MAKCDWAILCDYAFLDAGRKTCLIGIFDRIFAPAVPTSHHQAALALRLVGEPKEKVQLRVEIVRPTGEVLRKTEAAAELGDAGTLEFQLGLAGLPLPDFGIYAFNIYIANDLTRTVGITVARPPQKSAAEAAQ